MVEVRWQDHEVEAFLKVEVYLTGTGGVRVFYDGVIEIDPIGVRHSQGKRRALVPYGTILEVVFIGLQEGKA